MARTVIEWALRLAVAGVFLYAGALKAWDTQQFALDVQNYQLTSWTLSIVVAVYLPWIEIVAALALLVRRLYEGALMAILGMTLVFLGAIGSAWARGLDISCGCFGKGVTKVSYPELIGRDLALLAAVTALIWLEARKRRMTAPASPSESLTVAQNVKE